MAEPAASPSLIPFDFDGAPVRVLLLDGVPHFVGRDVADRLGYSDPTNAIKKHCKGVAKHHPLQTAGGMQNVRVLAEPDVLRLIIGSKLPAAQRFEQWVFDEVLPAIRRDGGYMVAIPDETPDALMARALLVANATLERQKAQLAELAPKAAALERMAESDGSFSVTVSAKLLSVSPKWLFGFMAEHGWIYRRPVTQEWTAYQSRIDSKHLEQRKTTVIQHNGSERTVSHCVVLPRGLALLAEAINRSDTSNEAACKARKAAVSAALAQH
jgi:prophage antirepressor-like protein